jgi:HD superfamily phosphohydrolase YqeK
MSAAASIEAAAAGRLPDWAVAGAPRIRHIIRVASLLDEWSRALELADDERHRWRAAAWLHDALRDAEASQLRALVPEPLRDLHPAVLHGPAVAARLEAEGVRDRGLLSAIAGHTVGSAEFDELGRLLYIADFLEPGRTFEPAWRASLRARMPASRDAVLRQVAAARIAHVLRTGHTLRPETAAFWNQLAGRS